MISPAQNQLYQMLDSGRLPSGLLFSGAPGAGKLDLALSLAKDLLCEQGKKRSCGTCGSCIRVDNKESESLLFIEPSSLEIKLDDVRKIRQFLALQSIAPARVVIISQADALNLQAVNSLLKSVEEPPQKSYFIFLSSQEGALPQTLRSRLQYLYLPPRHESKMKELEDHAELRELGLKLFKEILDKKQLAFAMTLPKELKDRKKAKLICKFWKWLIRDARLMQAGEQENFINKDQQAWLQELSSLPSWYLDFFLEKMSDLEKNLQGYGDCVLCFENFMVAIIKPLKESV